MALTIAIDPHPVLEVGVFLTRFSSPLAGTQTPADIAALIAPTLPPNTPLSGAPLAGSDQVRGEVRQLLRSGGFKPGALIGRTSGEAFQLGFAGQGFVIVQPSENAHGGGGSGGGAAGGIGGMLGRLGG